MKSPYDPIEEGDKDRPDKRAAWNARGREAPKGQSAAALRLKAHQQKMTMRAARSAEAAKGGVAAPALAAPSGWVALGPAPLVSDSNFFGMVSGRTTSVAIDPSDATGGTVYVGAAYGGVWKSTNATAVPASSVTWTPVTDQQASLATGAISVKSDGSVVLVGTGEPNNAIDSYYGVGILRSTDKGATWNLITSADSGTHPFAGLGVSKFAWSTAAGQTGRVVAATATTSQGFFEGNITGTTNRGLYLSTDNGVTWAYQAPADGSTPISVSDVVYNATAGKFFAAVRYHGIYSSTNGASWTRLANASQPGGASGPLSSTTNCPTAVPNPPTCPMFRGQLAVVPGRDEMYFWYVDPNDTDGGIWQSTDGGSTWKSISETGIAVCGDSFGCGTQQAFYNLEIYGVPNGTATDLYAGAVNLFKCTVNSGQTTCSQGNWLNLTHVYGCPAIASVHPDEHGLDFKVVGGNAIMYFANDGGVYRALNGFAGLHTGTCGQTNSFDNLNGTIGSMTQFVSFSVHPTLQDTVLGGTQDNGSPASTTATTSSQFFTANGGDGGYNEINPTTPTQWFASNTDVSMQACNTAPNCSSANFIQFVFNSTLGGDFGPFYTPFILDPQNSGEMLIGTCRVWRGTTGGTGFGLLSVNFDSGVSSPCSGGETNLIRGLAAGGPKVNGFSNVVYATSEGAGPNGGAVGGLIGVTTNAATTSMIEVSENINPSGYTISSVATDNSDATGKTAFVGIMGFGVSHVWKTTNAGGTGQGTTDWTNWTGGGGTALPNAPVNALLVDSAAHLVYAGTDVGVFVSPTPGAGGSWTEVGPAAVPGGAAGYLPNVPVSAIRMFNSGGVKKLRVSTYGRGIWQFTLAAPTPDYTLAISNTPLTVGPNQTATFNGTLTAVNGYNSPVNLTCGAGAPGACTFTPSSPITPTTGGVAFTVSMNSGGTAGTFNFNIHTVGNDVSATTHDAPVVLNVADFTWTTTNTTHTVLAGQTTLSYDFIATPTGAATFFSAVTPSCGNTNPALTTCVFNPPQIASGSGATTVHLTITTTGPNTGTGATGTHLRQQADRKSSPWLPLTLPIGGILFAGFAGRKAAKHSAILGLCVSLVLLGLLAACGGGSSTPPPPPPITVTVTPSTTVNLFANEAGNQWPAPQTQKFTAVVNNSTNQTVTWAVTGGAANGSIDATGLYTAPATAPTQALVTITATAQAGGTPGSGKVNIQTPTAVGTTNLIVTATEGGGIPHPATGGTSTLIVH